MDPIVVHYKIIQEKKYTHTNYLEIAENHARCLLYFYSSYLMLSACQGSQSLYFQMKQQNKYISLIMKKKSFSLFYFRIFQLKKKTNSQIVFKDQRHFPSIDPGRKDAWF